MLIAVSTEGLEITSAVSEKFEECHYLLFVETDDMTVNAIENTDHGISLAEKAAQRDVEAVITGEFTLETFNVLADACITRYKGFGYSAEEAIRRMDENTLTYIRSADNDNACQSDHGEACNCGEHD